MVTSSVLAASEYIRVAFSNLLMQKKRHGSRKHLIFQKVIVSYMKDAENDILFTMKVNEMKVCKDVYGLIWHLVT